MNDGGCSHMAFFGLSLVPFIAWFVVAPWFLNWADRAYLQFTTTAPAIIAEGPPGLVEEPVRLANDTITLAGIVISCATTADDGQLFGEQGPYTRHFDVRCPKYCEVTNGGFKKVYGTGEYAGSSSICLAAIHAGVIQEMHGGVASIAIWRDAVSVDNVEQFQGSTGHGVTSLSLFSHPTRFKVQRAADQLVSSLPFVSMDCVASLTHPYLQNYSSWILGCPANCMGVWASILMTAQSYVVQVWG